MLKDYIVAQSVKEDAVIVCSAPSYHLQSGDLIDVTSECKYTKPFLARVCLVLRGLDSETADEFFKQAFVSSPVYTVIGKYHAYETWDEEGNAKIEEVKR